MKSSAGLSLLVVASLVSSCGGTAESAEEHDNARVPVAEAPAEASEMAGVPAAVETAAPAPTSAGEERPAVVERSAPAKSAAEQPVSAKPATPAPEPAVEPAAPARVLAAGATLTLVLDDELSTKSNRAGDPFTAHLVADVLAPDGEVLLPEGTSVHGLVTEAQESPSSDVPAMLRLQIVDAQVGGEVVPLVADVENMQLEAEAKDSDRRTAGKVAVGAAAGALLGKVLGKSGTKGAVAGAAAGAAVAVVTRDGHATLPRGAQMTIRLVESLVIP